MNISIVGTAGLPASYGGFETLVENLVLFNEDKKLPVNITVYCSGRSGRDIYRGAKLKYINIPANGFWSIFYDILSIITALSRKQNVILVLGVSGSIILPFIKRVRATKFIVNIDGIEWKREKWGFLARSFLRFSEYLSVKYADSVIADNQAVADYVFTNYGRRPSLVAYGGDHALRKQSFAAPTWLPNSYSCTICRVEPENNVNLILEAFCSLPDKNIVFVGNWNSSKYGRRLKERFSHVPNIFLRDPIYDLDELASIRSNCDLYIHGHSAGGTNPSLVEIMHFCKPILAFDCSFNRSTTENSALYFSTTSDLVKKVREARPEQLIEMCSNLRNIAETRYTWEIIGEAYFNLLIDSQDNLQARQEALKETGKYD